MQYKWLVTGGVVTMTTHLYRPTEEERRQREQLEVCLRDLQEDKNALEMEVRRLQEKLAQTPKVSITVKTSSYSRSSALVIYF